MSFIEEFKRLQAKTPRIALVCVNSENSAYTNYALGNKNSYLVYGSHYNEEVYYSGYAWKDRDCADTEEAIECELCYESVYCGNCYDCSWCEYCFTCSDCSFCYDCVSSRDCFMSAGLRNAQYVIMNKQYSREEYVEKLKEFPVKTRADITQRLSEFEKIKRQVPRTFAFQRNCENSAGDDMRDCKSCYETYNAKFCEDLMYAYSQVSNCKDSMDVTNIGYDPSELLYECIGNTGAYNCHFCNACWHNSNLWYCDLVFNSHDCLGCISVNHAEYRILNKQYSKEEYFKKFEEIKDELQKDGQWGRNWLPATYPLEDTMAALWK